MNSELILRLVSLAAAGHRPPCGDPDTSGYWTSEDPDERALAQRRCRGCPALRECLDEGLTTKATHGVWGGHDLTNMPKATRSRLRAKHLAATTDDAEALF
ncbi:WhiB family transcriptional regulator [Aestuariimicrobium sp. Y1814]|uniref:WhiB family transcriptional regulator n=1 Tax=Aestuariimicrobium sp. Y1814 TaxID=3418742 RepID=UPI003DA716B3